MDLPAAVPISLLFSRILESALSDRETTGFLARLQFLIDLNVFEFHYTCVGSRAVPLLAVDIWAIERFPKIPADIWTIVPMNYSALDARRDLLRGGCATPEPPQSTSGTLETHSAV